jgi:hypothetical protein
MKKILATTALVVIMAGGTAFAASTSPLSTYQSQPSDIKASQFIGQRVYATETQLPADTTVAAGSEKDWDDIGEINEVILGRDGAVKAVIVGVGGFLGMGEKDVAVPLQQVKFVRDGSGQDDYFLVLNANKQLLTDAPAYTTAEAPATTDATTTTADNLNDSAAPAATDTMAATDAKPADAMTTASTNRAADDSRPLLTRPEVTREGYRAAEATELTTDKLTGATVYGKNDENVGEINRLVLSADGKIDRVVLDIGGFLGMGEREIAVTMDELNIVRNANGDDVRVYIDANKQALEAQPEYKNTNG